MPRRLNLCKPVGISKRQKLAWRISVYLKRAIPPKIHNKRKIHENELKKRKNKKKMKLLPMVIKRPTESRPEQPSKSNTVKGYFNKSHFRIIEDFVKSKNFNLFCTKTGTRPLAGKILSLQMKTRLFCPLREKFTVEDKIFALSLYTKFGLKKYKDLSEFCALPPIKSLLEIMKHVPCLPGLHKQLFDNLKRSVVKLDDTDKYCSIIFQEIPLAREELLKTNENGDFDEDNFCYNEKLKGDNVTVIILRGLNRDWRQPVSFHLTKGKIKSYDLASLLREVIILALEISLRVVAVVFNKKESYIEAVSLLNSESLFSTEEDDRTSSIDIIEIDSNHDSYPEAPIKSESNQLRNVTQKKPSWINGCMLHLRNNEIALLYNPTNLLRVVRNKWLTYDISFAENGKVKQASWNHIMKLYSADEGNEDTKFCPKLTHHHVILEEIDKGSIRCCTQVFSQRVSSAMRCLAKLGGKFNVLSIKKKNITKHI